MRHKHLAKSSISKNITPYHLVGMVVVVLVSTFPLLDDVMDCSDCASV